MHLYVSVMLKHHTEGLTYYLQIRDDFCILLALPSSDKKLMDPHQTQSLQTGFIDYLTDKGAAGIMNVPIPGGNEVCNSISWSLLM